MYVRTLRASPLPSTTGTKRLRLGSLGRNLSLSAVPTITQRLGNDSVVGLNASLVASSLSLDRKAFILLISPAPTPTISSISTGVITLTHGNQICNNSPYAAYFRTATDDSGCTSKHIAPTPTGVPIVWRFSLGGKQPNSYDASERDPGGSYVSRYKGVAFSGSFLRNLWLHYSCKLVEIGLGRSVRNTGSPRWLTPYLKHKIKSYRSALVESLLLNTVRRSMCIV